MKDAVEAKGTWNRGEMAGVVATEPRVAILTFDLLAEAWCSSSL